MKYQDKQVGNVVILYPKGNLDHNNSPIFENHLLDLIENQNDTNYLINLQDIDFMSSSGLKVFLFTSRKLKRQNRRLALCNVNDVIKELYEIINLEPVFKIYQDEEEAIKALSFSGVQQ